MILYLNEERAYLYWVAHHRGGFVLDCLRKPTPRQLVLHRATCPEIKAGAAKRTHYTTGKHAKACALNADELRSWATEQAAAEPTPCTICRPQEDPHPQPGDAGAHLTPLTREILSFVLEVAAIHLDNGERPYHLTVADVAQCFEKTAGQITRPLLQLWEQGYLDLAGRVVPGHTLAPRRPVYPTAAALRTLPDLPAVEADAEQEARKLMGVETES
jgi:hypothetical protein